MYCSNRKITVIQLMFLLSVVSLVLLYASFSRLDFNPATDLHTNTSLSIPSVFSPNGDSINDYFHISSVGLSDFSIRIQDRKGRIVFESFTPTFKWDGIGSDGKMVTEGVYTCSLHAINKAGKHIQMRQPLTIIR